MFKFAKRFSQEMQMGAREEARELKLGRFSSSLWTATVGVVAFLVMILVQLIIGAGDVLFGEL